MKAARHDRLQIDAALECVSLDLANLMFELDRLAEAVGCTAETLEERERRWSSRDTTALTGPTS